MDNMRMDCSYLVLSLARHLKCLTLHWANFKRTAIFFFFPPAAFRRSGSKTFSDLRACDLHANVRASSLSVGDQCDHPRTQGKPKVLKSSKWRAQGSVGFCISHLLYGFKKTGERGQLNIHIIWGYIQSLGFKLLDERQLWINVIFSLTYRHLLRARKKVFVCAPTINIPYYSSLRFIVPRKRPEWLSNVTDF